MNRSYEPRPRRPLRLALHPSRLIADLGVLLVLGAMSLPFVTGDGFQQRSVAGDALPALLLVLPVFALTLVPDQSRPLPPALAWAALAPAVAAVPFAVLKYLDASTLAETVRGSVGMGPRLLVMGSVVVLGGVILGLVRVLTSPPPMPVAAEEAALASPVPPEATPATSRRRGIPTRRGRVAAGTPGTSPRPSPSRQRRSAGPQPRVPAEKSAAPSAGRVPERRPPAPRPTDPPTEPTVPAQRPVQPWWPDDLEDLFS